MWTGGKPPRIPKEALKKPDTTSSGVAFRSNVVNSELEALKQRGLAKILNKHFTEEAQKIAEEKAAVDAAVADLEQRKANTSEFQASFNNELSPLDSMYVSVNAWRNECRRKERETLLLYQRYVDKFGATGQVRLPETLVPRAANNKESKSWIIKDDGSCASQQPAAPSVPPSRLVPNMAAEIERTLDDYIEKGALSFPSVEMMGIEQTFHTAREKEEVEFRNHYRRILESRGIDAKSPEKSLEKKDNYFGPGWVESLGPNGKSLTAPSINELAERIRELEANKKKTDTVGKDEEDEEEGDAFDSAPFNAAGIPDDCSVVSGLTSVHSQITRSVIQDCERTVYEFLKVEKNEIQKIIQEEEKADAEMRSGNILAAKATQEAENMVKQMEDILHEYKEKHSDDISVNKQTEGRHFHTENAEENWMVYYDEFYQQDYYHESNSNRTQWDPPGNESPVGNASSPGKDNSSASVTGSGSDNTPSPSAVLDHISISSGRAGLISSEDVIPENGNSNFSYSRRSSYESRISQYRRKRRKERKRKLIALLFLTVVCLVGGLTYLKIYAPQNLESAVQSLESNVREFITQTGIRDAISQTKDAISHAKEIGIQDAISHVKDAISHAKEHGILDAIRHAKDVMSRSKDTEIRDAVSHTNELDVSNQPAEQEMPPQLSGSDTTFDDATANITHEWTVSVASEFEQHVCGDDEVCVVEACDQEEELKSLELISLPTIEGGLQLALNAAFDVSVEKEHSDIMHRPWACNIPFAYLVHPRCYRLAKQSPVFDLQELVSSMFQ